MVVCSVGGISKLLPTITQHKKKPCVCICVWTINYDFYEHLISFLQLLTHAIHEILWTRVFNYFNHPSRLYCCSINQSFTRNPSCVVASKSSLLNEFKLCAVFSMWMGEEVKMTHVLLPWWLFRRKIIMEITVALNAKTEILPSKENFERELCYNTKLSYKMSNY